MTRRRLSVASMAAGIKFLARSLFLYKRQVNQFATQLKSLAAHVPHVQPLLKPNTATIGIHDLLQPVCKRRWSFDDGRNKL